MGNSVLAFLSSGWFVPWVLVGTLVLIGFLMCLRAGLRVEKPRAKSA